MDEECAMHSKSHKEEFMPCGNLNEVVHKLLKPHLLRNQIGLETVLLLKTGLKRKKQQ